MWTFRQFVGLLVVMLGTPRRSARWRNASASLPCSANWWLGRARALGARVG